MQKWNRILVAGVAALCIGGFAVASACDHDKASAANGTCTKGEKASMACALKGSMASIFKEAPGTKTEFKKVDNGVSFVVTAASQKYVPVVQKVVMTSLEDMHTTTGVKMGAACPYSKTTMTSSCSAVKVDAMKAETASSTKSSTPSCCAHKTSEQASMTSVQCPDWMKVLCGANCEVTKTANGVVVTWTTEKPEQVEAIRSASEQLLAQAN